MKNDGRHYSISHSIHSRKFQRKRRQSGAGAVGDFKRALARIACKHVFAPAGFKFFLVSCVLMLTAARAVAQAGGVVREGGGAQVREAADGRSDPAGGGVRGFVPRDDTWVADGIVKAIVQTTDTIYIGGEFENLGPNTGSFAVLDPATGAPQAPFPRVLGTVNACASDGEGGWFIGGDFRQVGSSPRRNFAHILPDGSADPKYDWAVDGPVNAITLTTDTVYLGGDFTYIGPITGHAALLDAKTGEADLSFPQVDATVTACLADGAGGWFLAGFFERVGGEERHRLAHILPNGILDPRWRPEINGYPCTLALSLDRSAVYVGGSFMKMNGVERFNLAALDAATGALLPWNPAASYKVKQLVVSPDGNIVYVSGLFWRIGGRDIGRLAATDARTGQVLDWSPENGGLLIAVTESKIFNDNGWGDFWILDAASGKRTSEYPFSIPNGWIKNIRGMLVCKDTLFIGAQYYQFDNDESANLGLAIFDTRTEQFMETQTPISLESGIQHCEPYVSIDSLATSGTVIYGGGSFSRAGKQERRNIVALDSATGQLLDWSSHTGCPPNTYSCVKVTTLAVAGSKILASGSFISAGGKPRMYSAAFDRATGKLKDESPNAKSAVHSISGSNVTVEDDLTNTNGQKKDKSAIVDTGTGQHLPPSAGSHVARSASTASCGLPINPWTCPRSGLAALDAATGAPISWNPNPTFSSAPASISAIALSEDRQTIYVSGDFDHIGGQPRNGLAALDRNGNVLSWNPGSLENWENWRGSCFTLLYTHGKVYAGGRFTSVGGESRKSLAALDGNTGALLSWNPGIETTFDYYYQQYYEGDCSSLAASGSMLYVGGNFVRAGGQPRNHLAAFDLETGQLTSWNPDAENSVHALALSPDRSLVYAGGEFLDIGGAGGRYVAAIRADTGLATGWNPRPDDWVYSLAVGNGAIYMGGRFIHVGKESREFLAAVSAVTGLPTEFNAGQVYAAMEPGYCYSEGSCGCYPEIHALSLSSSSLLSGGNFGAIAGNVRPCLARFDLTPPPPAGDEGWVAK